MIYFNTTIEIKLKWVTFVEFIYLKFFKTNYCLLEADFYQI